MKPKNEAIPGVGQELSRAQINSLAKQAVPGWDGRIWPTHVIEVQSWTLT